jgi:hypothetical protein
MRKFTSILKVLTFINLEIFLLCGLLVVSIIYGRKYLKNSTQSVQSITTSLRENEIEKIENGRKIDRFNELDNQLLNRSLKNLDISDNLDVMMTYKDSFGLSQPDYEKFDSLLIDKAIIFRVIKTFKKSTDIEVDKNDFIKTEKTSEIVPRKTVVSTKKLFGKIQTDTIVSYDTLNRENKIFDSQAFEKNKSLSARVDYNSFQKYIFENNSLTLSIKSILNNTIIKQGNQVSKSQSDLIAKLNKNLNDYFKVITIIIVFFFVVLLLLIRDLRRKSKKEYRDKYLISMILNKKD